MPIFEIQKIPELSFFSRTFKFYPKENYIIELQNLLANNEQNLLSINLKDIEKLRKKYRINKDDLKGERELLFEKYFSFCLSDKRISDEEKKVLSFLCSILGFGQDYFMDKIIEKGKIIYRNMVKDVVSDDIKTPKEVEELELIKKEFNLSETDVDNIYGDECFKRLKPYLDKIASSRRASPDEEKIINEISKGLNLSLKFSDDAFKKYRLYWDIENSELSPVSSPINLQKNELFYYSTSIKWYEERTHTSYVSYSGLTSKFRIMKGVYWRMGAIAPARHAQIYMKNIDSGNVYLTNKRIIFTGQHMNKTLPLSKILFITPFADGVEIGKDTGRKPFFSCSDPELLGIYILRLLKEFT